MDRSFKQIVNGEEVHIEFEDIKQGMLFLYYEVDGEKSAIMCAESSVDTEGRIHFHVYA